MSVTGHHTPELAVRREPIGQDQIDAEPSVQSGEYLNIHFKKIIERKLY
jgi:hypothetical protein